MKLILVRHGQTFFNKMDYNQGWFDSPLTELGLQQAEKAKEFIKDIHIDYCFCSPSERAVDTVEMMLEGRNIKVIRDKRLKEMNFGMFEGYPNSLFIAVNAGISEVMEETLEDFDGESKELVINRELDCIRELERNHPDQTILIGGHGVSLKELMLALTKDDVYQFIPGFKWMSNCDTVVIEGNQLNYHIVDYYRIK